MVKLNGKSKNEVPRVQLRYLVPYLLIFVFVPILTFLAGRWVDILFAFPSFPPFPLNLLIGFLVFSIGLYIGITATRHLRKFGKGLPWGDIEKEGKSRILVTDGPYAFTRNPMVLGYTLLPGGMGILFRSIGMAVAIPLVVLLVMVVWLKVWEEKDLERQFGEEYLEYKRNTPFLLPRVFVVLRVAFSIKQKKKKVG
jgi:protein-S-isoprenylcysteine O-methyltransferase Ste14